MPMISALSLARISFSPPLLPSLVPFLYSVGLPLKFSISLHEPPHQSLHPCLSFPFSSLLPHLRENATPLTIWVWQVSLHIFSSSSLSFLVSDILSFFFMNEWDSIVCLHPIYFNRSLVYGHVGLFPVLPIVISFSELGYECNPIVQWLLFQINTSEWYSGVPCLVS